MSLSTRASVSTIYSWIKTSVGIVPVTGLHKTIKEQEKKISRLEDMIKIIQNADFFKNVSLSERLEIIDELWEEYGINASCDALDVAHDTFHNHQKRGKGKTIYTKSARKNCYLKFRRLTKNFIISMVRIK
ncbi:MAG: hypothetical protein LUG21_07365 [Clostridiales bacterium]|nr:hypothetical protein [Clostridiales bacterium]